ncbi:MAG: HypC/HybG/HupF family hydrogenase formation chaperone [Desulfovibrio sp.]|jgi:hydrogenase expression/formation protein HypC|nr:HypC/HybG/HupF family hydrogenase formation chaperone [Desulfovibrio sp.]
MCLAVPVQVVELQPNDMARVRVGESETFLTASTMLLPQPPDVGDYLIVHAGFALHSLTPDEARQSLETLREMAVLLQEEQGAAENAL